MPIYEYVCTHCKRKFQKLVGVVAQPAPLQCPRCQSADVDRRLSRFARLRTEDETFDSLAEEMEAAGESEDPKTLRRLMRDMGTEMGEDLDEEFDQMMEEDAQVGSDDGTDAD